MQDAFCFFMCTPFLTKLEMIYGDAIRVKKCMKLYNSENQLFILTISVDSSTTRTSTSRF
jgi:hypothetical protein